MVCPSLRLKSCFLYNVAASDCARAGAIVLPDAAEVAATLTSLARCTCFSWSDCRNTKKPQCCLTLSHSKLLCFCVHHRANAAQVSERLTKATLKSKASCRSVNPNPRNACRLLAGSTTRRTKFLELSEAGSTAMSRCPIGTGHIANKSPLRGRVPGFIFGCAGQHRSKKWTNLSGSSNRISAASPLAVTLSLPVNILSATFHSPLL